MRVFLMKAVPLCVNLNTRINYRDRSFTVLHKKFKTFPDPVFIHIVQHSGSRPDNSESVNQNKKGSPNPSQCKQYRNEFQKHSKAC